MSGPFILAFGIWMLLTADFSWVNAAVGLAAAAVVSFLPRHRFSAWQLIRLVLSGLIRFPIALWETLLMVLLPHKLERTHRIKLKTPNNPWGIFCQTFITTFTPRTLVVSEEEDDELLLHSIEREGRS